MTISRLSILHLLWWQRKNVLIFAWLSTAVVLAEELTGEVAGLLPDMPVSVLGAAIGIFVTFRTNSAYNRWWEARTLWGGLVNASRHFADQAIAYGPDADAASRAVLRQALYPHVLRCALRGGALEQDQDVCTTARDASVDLDQLHTSATSSLLREQHLEVTRWANEHGMDERRLQSLDDTLRVVLDVQGGCERIKNTSLPSGYGFIAEALVRTYAIILPLAVVGRLHWLALPVSILVCLAFKLISEVGRVLEDPFTPTWEALPLLTLCRTIERDLREAVGSDARPVPAPRAHPVVGNK
jgi:putative membrane protein